MEAKWPTERRGWAAEGSPSSGTPRVHLVERATVEFPEAPDNVSIIGCDAANGTYFQLYSGERGVCSVYEMNATAPQHHPRVRLRTRPEHGGTEWYGPAATPRRVRLVERLA